MNISPSPRCRTYYTLETSSPPPITIHSQKEPLFQILPPSVDFIYFRNPYRWSHAIFTVWGVASFAHHCKIHYIFEVALVHFYYVNALEFIYSVNGWYIFAVFPLWGLINKAAVNILFMCLLVDIHTYLHLLYNVE